MAVIALDCMIEHHMIEVAFNTFLVFAFADLDPVLGKEERGETKETATISSAKTSKE